MSAIALLLICFALGAGVAHLVRPPAGMVHGLNWWVLNVALPALVLDLIPRLEPRLQFWFLIASMWLVFAGGWLLFALLGRWFDWTQSRIGAMVLVCGLGSTSFIGYPVMLALRGKAGLSLAVVAGQLGTFPLMASFGIVVASLYSGRRPKPRLIMRRLFTFPSFIALLVSVISGLFGGWPEWLYSVLAQLGQTLTPLALFSVGLQFRFHIGSGQWRAMGWGLGWKLLFAPLLCWGLGVVVGVNELILDVGVLQASMAPMVSSAILANEYGLDSALANTLLGVGTVLSLLTVPLGNLWLLATS